MVHNCEFEQKQRRRRKKDENENENEEEKRRRNGIEFSINSSHKEEQMTKNDSPSVVHRKKMIEVDPLDRNW